ncbi:Drug/metabolite transporter [Cynara cardunculus var. scolymus]|uniref:WAT1-related protein n=1 Tax=Cynara cardunculus var. scolymus TaxID=59895 RepID=A0A103XYP9_CYNCS|nr:Drug/metabolite transporter [Cynara cardunculus var. scolymus]
MAETGGGAITVTQKIKGWFPERVQLHIAMLALQFGYAGFHVVSRAALNMGISKIVFPVYRNILAFVLLLPFAYFLEKYEGKAADQSQFSYPVLPARDRRDYGEPSFLLIGFGQHFSDLRLRDSELRSRHHIPHGGGSPASSLTPLIEKVRIDRKDGISKVAGTVFCIAGASVITLYKGPTIYSPSPSLHSIRATSPVLQSLGDANGKSWALGCLFLIGHCLSWSGWLVLQAPVLKKYPARLSFTSYQCFFGVLQFLVLAAFMERDINAWLIHSGAELFSVFYAVSDSNPIPNSWLMGVVASGIAFAVQIWCIDRGGPVFVALYQPVQTLVVALMASVALGEEFYLGGIIGAVLIITGLYLVLWGKNEERKFMLQKQPALVQAPTSTDHGAPRTTSHMIKSSITQPLLPQSTENV